MIQGPNPASYGQCKPQSCLWILPHRTKGGCVLSTWKHYMMYCTFVQMSILATLALCSICVYNFFVWAHSLLSFEALMNCFNLKWSDCMFKMVPLGICVSFVGKVCPQKAGKGSENEKNGKCKRMRCRKIRKGANFPQ